MSYNSTIYKNATARAAEDGVEVDYIGRVAGIRAGVTWSHELGAEVVEFDAEDVAALIRAYHARGDHLPGATTADGRPSIMTIEEE